MLVTLRVEWGMGTASRTPSGSGGRQGRAGGDARGRGGAAQGAGHLSSVLAIDLGTGGPKVALVSREGEVLASEAEPTPVLLRPGGGAEQRPADWWNAIAAASRRLLARDCADVRALAVTGQWAATVAADEAGQPLADALIWMDARRPARASPTMTAC